MDAVLVSTKGQIVIPLAVRKALGIEPGMRVRVGVAGKQATLTPVGPKSATTLADIQALVKGKKVPKVALDDMRVKDSDAYDAGG
jgi:AbrB family looped-hinge helix DNA binding protein